MNRLREGIEGNKEEERVHGNLHDREQLRPPEKDECTMDERMHGEQEREQKERWSGESCEGQRKVEQYLQHGRQPGAGEA